MSTAYIRGIDETTYAALQKEAKRKGISLSELVRLILDHYVSRSEIESVDAKYRTFVREQIALYRLDQDEMRELLERNKRLYLQIMDFLMQGRDE